MYDVIERVQMSSRPPSESKTEWSVNPVPCRITAVWQREESDSNEKDYDIEVRLLKPEGHEVYLSGTTFRFEYMFHRFVAITHLGPAINTPGMYRIRSLVKPAGADDDAGVTQDFPIYVDDGNPPA